MSLRSLVLRALVLTGGWWALSEGDASGYGFGAPMVTLALVVSLRLPRVRSPRWSPLGVVRLTFAFISRSLVGGVDVARLALSPRGMPAPALIGYALRLPAGAGRNLFMGTLSLMPGTLAASLEGDRLEIHVLVDGGERMILELRAWEERIATALGEALEDRNA